MFGQTRLPTASIYDYRFGWQHFDVSITTYLLSCHFSPWFRNLEKRKEIINMTSLKWSWEKVSVGVIPCFKCDSITNASTTCINECEIKTVSIRTGKCYFSSQLLSYFIIRFLSYQVLFRKWVWQSLFMCNTGNKLGSLHMRLCLCWYKLNYWACLVSEGNYFNISYMILCLMSGPDSVEKTLIKSKNGRPVTLVFN